jgi:hypothetical protein
VTESKYSRSVEQQPTLGFSPLQGSVGQTPSRKEAPKVSAALVPASCSLELVTTTHITTWQCPQLARPDLCLLGQPRCSKSKLESPWVRASMNSAIQEPSSLCVLLWTCWGSTHQIPIPQMGK